MEIKKDIFLEEQTVEVRITSNDLRLSVHYTKGIDPLTATVFNLKSEKYVLTPLVEYLNRCANQSLTGTLTIIVHKGNRGMYDWIYNASHMAISFFESLSMSIAISVGEEEDSIKVSPKVPQLYLALDDYGQIVDLHVSKIIEMIQFNELLSIASQYYGQYKEKMMISNTKPLEEKEIVIATKNKGKAKEFESIFGDKGYTVKTLLDFPELPEVAETGSTFEENARLKADTISQLLNRPVLADDSGLCVDALHGQPGIHSARFAKDHDDAANNAKLLSELAGIETYDRTAHFHCTLVFAAPGKDDLVVEGEVEGLIAGIPQGENGFGYDPLFYLPELDKTMAQLTPEQKNKLSHRAVATAKLSQVWEEWLND